MRLVQDPTDHDDERLHNALGQAPPRVDELALRAQQGDRAALHELLERIDADGLARIAVRRVLVDAGAVEDVSQDVLIVVAEKLANWDPRRRFTTWLYSVARNKAIDHLRLTRTGHPMIDELTSDQRRISSLITTRETVRAAIAELPAAHRQAVELRDIEELDYDEISRMLDLPASTVRTRVSRGRAMLAAALGATEADLR